MTQIRLYIEDEEKLVVKPDQVVTHYVFTGTTMTNIGDGEGEVYAGTSGDTFLIKTIKAGTNVSIDNEAEEVVINVDGDFDDYIKVTEFNEFTGQTQTILTELGEDLTLTQSGLETLKIDFTGHTSNDDIHFTQAEIQIDYSQVDNTPTTLSEFTNDTGYITAASIPTTVSSFTNDANYIAQGSNISQLVNDSGYITAAAIPTVTGSGDTTVTLSGNTYVVYSESGDEAVWGNITGTLSDQTDLQTALNLKTNQVDFTGHTSNTDIHFPMSGISITESQISDFGVYALQSTVTGLTSNFNSHTGDTSIHFEMSGITITRSQISDFITIVGSGDTTVTLSGNTYIVNTDAGDEAIWGNITGSLSNQTDLMDALDQKVDYPIYHDDLQTISDEIERVESDFEDEIATHINVVTFLGDGEEIGVRDDKILNLKSLKVAGALSITGDTETITIQTTAEGVWGGIEGDLSNQTDLMDALDQKVDYPIYHDDLQTLGDDIDELSDELSGHTSNTDIHFPMTGITIDYSQIDNTPYIPSEFVDVIEITGTTLTIDETHLNKILEFTASGQTTVTLPSGLTNGFQVTFVRVGDGDIVFTDGDDDSTIRSKEGFLNLKTQYGAVSAYFRNNNWTLIGDLE